jgi:beta-lactamase regulating signal transducer with metallopeptidase domain
MRGDLNKALSHAAMLDDPRWSDSLAALSAAMGLGRPPCLVTIEGGASPFVCGVIRPMLVLPRPLIETLSVERWRAVILH